MTNRNRTSPLYLVLITVVLASSAVCNLNLFPPAGNPLPSGVIVRLINRTGEIVQAELAFLNQGVEIRRTRVRLNPTGPGSTTDILPTPADTFNALALSASTLPPNGQGGIPLILKQFALGVDFELGETFAVNIDPPSGDCNQNGQPDDSDIANGGSTDCNADSVPDECQTDADADGLIDPCDACPTDAAKTAPGACGCNAADLDGDGDGAADCNDGCPNDSAKTAPGACGCGVAESDRDGDGTPDCNDGCPDDGNKSQPGICGCGVSETDSDTDGAPDCVDGCPHDPNKVAPGECGCGVADTDCDRDGTPDCIDGCPEDPNKVVPGECGCGVADSDSDEDGTPDCLDGCPLDPAKIAPGECGCGTADTDSDKDGTPDCIDGCPQDPYKIAPGICGCGNPELIGDEDEDGVPDCLDVCPGGNDTIDCDANGVPDFCDRYVYWSQVGPFESLIVRKVPTSQPCTTQPVAPDEYYPSELDVDGIGCKVYWLASDGETQVIRRSDLDGGNIQTMPLAILHTHGLAIDSPGRRLYWIEEFQLTIQIWAVNLEDPELEPFMVYQYAGDDPYGLAVDPVAHVVTWAQHDFVTYIPQLVKLDLNSPEPFLLVLYAPIAFSHDLHGTAIDGPAQKVYWVEQINTFLAAPEGENPVRTEIRRMNLDGDPLSIETIISMDDTLIRDIAVDSSAGRVYWTVTTPRQVMRSDLTGGNIETITAISTRYLLTGLGLRIP